MLKAVINSPGIIKCLIYQIIDFDLLQFLQKPHRPSLDRTQPQIIKAYKPRYINTEIIITKNQSIIQPSTSPLISIRIRWTSIYQII